MKIHARAGSSCHLRGSHEIVTPLQKGGGEHLLEDWVELAASFDLSR